MVHVYILSALDFLGQPCLRCQSGCLYGGVAYIACGLELGVMPMRRGVVGACVEGTDAEGGGCEGRTAGRFSGADLVFYGAMCVVGDWALSRNGGGW